LVCSSSLVILSSIFEINKKGQGEIRLALFIVLFGWD